MSQSMKKPQGLGRGLDALLGDTPISRGEAEPSAARQRLAVPIEFLTPCPSQPRRHFDDAAIEELAQSIAARGLLQPILVRPLSDGRYEIVAGERRWRAAQKAGVHDVPVVIRDLSDEDAAEIALIENVQRVDLSPVEEARAYQRLQEVHKRSQDEIAKAVGKSRSHISNLVRLLTLPAASLEALERGLITMGHARAILSAPNPDAAAALIIKRGLSVRQIERIVAEAQRTEKTRSDAPAASKPAGKKDADTRALEQDLAAALGLEVAIEHSAKGYGVVAIKYINLDQLDDLVRRLSGSGV